MNFAPDENDLAATVCPHHRDLFGTCWRRANESQGRYTRESLLPQHAPATRSRSRAPSSSPTICSEKNMLRNKTFAPEFCSLISNWFAMKEQSPGANLLHDSVSGASSLVCAEICFAGVCFRSKLPRVYWNLLCGSVFQEQGPSCVLVGSLPGSVFRERVSGASSFVCTGWSTYPGACFGSVFQEQAPSCVPAFMVESYAVFLQPLLSTSPPPPLADAAPLSLCRSS